MKPEVVFDGCPTPQLEPADLLAREAMKELERQIAKTRPQPRRSYEALVEAEANGTKKFTWITYDREYCARWRDALDQSESRTMLEKYKGWLVKTGRVQNGRPHDNMTNSVLFYAWFEKEEAGR